MKLNKKIDTTNKRKNIYFKLPCLKNRVFIKIFFIIDRKIINENIYKFLETWRKKYLQVKW